MPKVANGLQFDRRILVESRRCVRSGTPLRASSKHAGAIRALPYVNHADAGTYAEAIRLAEQTGGVPDIIATRRNGTLKYGFGLNMEQEITKDIGVFSRLGWNDGKTESFAFTAIDRLATGGVSVTGTRWHRPFDTVATEFTASGISGVHAEYLALGGHDFLIGDGRLEYGPEYIWESYYSARLFPGFFASFDLQHVSNPAYNQQRGPGVDSLDPAAFRGGEEYASSIESGTLKCRPRWSGADQGAAPRLAGHFRGSRSSRNSDSVRDVFSNATSTTLRPVRATSLAISALRS